MPFQFPVPTPADPEDIALDIYPLLRIFKDGKIERFLGTASVPAGTDPATGVQSKDVILSPEDGVGVRLYLPKDASPEKKLPLVVYFHGGGFCVETAWSPVYHTYLNALTSEANAVVASVNYRLAPEHPLPAAFEDSWRILKWAASHSGSGLIPEPAEPWLSEYVDFNKVFLAGDSAGGNISHHMAVKAGEEGLPGAKLDGIIPTHPFFSGVEPVGNERDLPPQVLAVHEKIWRLVHPGMEDLDDPVINPVKDVSKAGKVGCGRVLVCVAEKDALMARGVEYGEVMRRCRKEPALEVEVFKSVGMQHVFHLFDPECEEAAELMKKVVQFINGASTNV
uniref:Alpha/beta hydrolase fold-3 domain-containing protein n=1 Tax=Kalanchoe fedtschenkoi TaxID=63787 RepID=A0A7N0T1A2_KALFE